MTTHDNAEYVKLREQVVEAIRDPILLYLLAIRHRQSLHHFIREQCRQLVTLHGRDHAELPL